MINHFKVLGNFILERDGYYTTVDDLEKKKKFLKNHMLVPAQKTNGIKRAVCLNFDLEKNEFGFFLDKELSLENREYFFAFRVGAPRDTKKFLSTNNFESFLNKTFSDSLGWLEERRKKKESKAWFDRHIPVEYDRFIKTILDRFYVKVGEEFLLDETRMVPDQFEAFSKVRARMDENKKEKDKAISIEKVYSSFLNERFKDGESKELSPIFLVKFDGKPILENENEAVRSGYINLVFYDLYYRFITEGLIKKKSCHVCGCEKDVMGDLPFPMHFYGTTNPLYFENIKNKNAYKSFAVCNECMTDVLAGMKYTESDLRKYMFGMTCYLIPSLSEGDPFFEDKLNSAVKMLEKKGSTYSEDIEHLETLLKKSESKRKRSFSFNLLFYFSEKALFNILRYIPDIELRELIGKMRLFDEFTEMYKLNLIGEKGNYLTLQDIRNCLFPSDWSHPKPDYKVYGKAILDFLENFLNNHKISYYEMIDRFTDIFNRKFHRDKVDHLSPFKMVGFLSVLYKLNLLKEDNGMSEGQGITEIMKKEYTDFFEAHRAVYGNNVYRQGLFLLGTLISKIVYEQKKKGEGRKDSSTFLAKINYDGIPARRVDKLVNEVKKYAMIYPVYEEPGIWGNIADRLQGIDSSSLKPDEVVFYILTGISFQDYLGKKFALDKRLEGSNN